MHGQTLIQLIASGLVASTAVSGFQLNNGNGGLSRRAAVRFLPESPYPG